LLSELFSSLKKLIRSVLINSLPAIKKMADLEAALTKMRTNLLARGARSISGLSRQFRAMDSYDGNKQIDRAEFEVSM
jgi:hypothetical protein